MTLTFDLPSLSRLSRGSWSMRLDQRFSWCFCLSWLSPFSRDLASQGYLSSMMLTNLSKASGPRCGSSSSSLWTFCWFVLSVCQINKIVVKYELHIDFSHAIRVDQDVNYKKVFLSILNLQRVVCYLEFFSPDDDCCSDWSTRVILLYWNLFKCVLNRNLESTTGISTIVSFDFVTKICMVTLMW